MRISVLVVVCVAGAFSLPGNIFAAATVRLSASASSDGWLSSWEAPENTSSSHVWVIEAPWRNHVLLNFDQLRVDSSSYRCVNYLEVRDGETSWGRLLTRQCTTSTSPSPIYSNRNYLYVKFYSSESYSDEYGFSAKFRALPGDSPRVCPKILLGNNTGVIYSPGFPNNYPEDMYCDWLITAPRYHYLLLNFTELQLETGGCCCPDRLEVRDGRYSWNKELARYCASEYSPQLPVPSGRYARVQFTSDGSGGAGGFLLFFRFTDNPYETTTTAAPWTTPYYLWRTTPHLGWRSTPHLDSKHRTLAIAVPLAVAFVLALVIIAVVVCERHKRNPTPPPAGSTPRVLELQTFPLQVTVPTPQPFQPAAHPADNPPQYLDESRAALAGQPGGELPPGNNPDLETFSDQPPINSREAGAFQLDETQGENFYGPPPV